MIQIPNPTLPRNFVTKDPDQGKFNGTLTVALTNYLTNMATRVNGSLPKDGSEPLDGSLSITGDLAVGGDLGVVGASAFLGAVDFNDQTATNSGNLLAGRVKVTAFTSNGTHTPDADCLFADVYCWGGGGQGGGAGAAGAGAAAAGTGGSAGAKAYRRVTIAQIGASQSVTIGAGGSTSTAGANTGQAGANTTYGALVSAKGGEGGLGFATGAIGVIGAVSAPTQSATGDIRGYTVPGYPGVSAAVITIGGAGASNELGGGQLGARIATAGTNSQAGGAANSNTGGGGGGAATSNSGAAAAGGAGGSGLCVVIEYLRAA